MITDWSKPLLDGGLGPGSASQYLIKLIHIAATRYGIDLKVPFEQLPNKQQHILVYGPPRTEAPKTGFHGILSFLRDGMEDAKSDGYREYMMNFMSASTCPTCRGKRLRPESLAVKVGGLSISDFTGLSLNRALNTARELTFTAREALVAERIRKEVVERLEFLAGVGLSYLSLDRNAATLSGGEGQRVRLGRAMMRPKSKLVILDEPFRGLDRERRRALLKRARELWKQATILCVTHDVGETGSFSRVIVIEGGRVVEDGAPAHLAARPGSRYAALLEAETAVREGLWSSATFRRLRFERGRLAGAEGSDP